MPAPEVLMYSTQWCGYCERARRLLHEKGVAFAEIDVDSDAAHRKEMIRRSGRRSVPQIFIGEMHVGGYDDLRTLEAAGTLDRLLGRTVDPQTLGVT